MSPGTCAGVSAEGWDGARAGPSCAMASIPGMRRTTTRAPWWLALLLTLATACTHAPTRIDPPVSPPGAVAHERPPVLLVSVDGLAPAMLAWAPRLSAMARAGLAAEALRPSYPTLTFPNHTTLVTGLRPDRHGIVHNKMRDPVLGRFSNSTEAADDGRWWAQAVPLWVTAEQAGLPTATMFWPGSAAAIDGVRPRRWFAYDEGVSIDARVDTVLGWLSEPPATRPRFSTLYFEQVDEAAHDHGPSSRQVRAAVRAVDAALGRLLDTLAARGIAANVVVASDHGLAEVRPGRVVVIETMVDARDAQWITDGQVIGFDPLPGRTAQAEAALLGAHAQYDCWRKAELPPRWHYGAHVRVPAIVCQMHEGWDALPRERIAKRKPHATRGSHGYDNALPSMHAVLLATGPAFRTGARVGVVDNVDVYPLLARLVGVAPRAHDGDARSFDAVLREGW